MENSARKPYFPSLQADNNIHATYGVGFSPLRMRTIYHALEYSVYWSLCIIVSRRKRRVGFSANAPASVSIRVRTRLVDWYRDIS